MIMLITPRVILGKSQSFFENVHYGYSDEKVFNLHEHGKLVTLYPNTNGDCLFVMHGACATVVQEACSTETTYAPLRSFYDVLNSTCPQYYDEGGIYWPHEYFSALHYWGYDEWNYTGGFHKFVTNYSERTKLHHSFSIIFC